MDFVDFDSELDPPFNFDDNECLDRFDKKTLPKITWEWTDEGNSHLKDNSELRTKLLLIGNLTAANVFLRAHFELDKPIAKIFVNDTKPTKAQLRSHVINHPICELYSPKGVSPSDLLILSCQAKLQDEAANFFSKTLYQKLSCDLTIILDTIPNTTFLDGKRYDSGTVRVLRTDSLQNYISNDSWKPSFLESPILVKNIAAGIFSWNNIRNRKAWILLSLQNPLFLETSTVEAWEIPLKSILPSHIQLKEHSAPYRDILEHCNTRRPLSLYV